MPRDIVEAYALAMKARENSSRKAFQEVIDFCENDLKCSTDNSRKRNTLLLWSYDRLAQSHFKSNDYKAAYNLWKKALPLAGSVDLKLNLGWNMLAAADKEVIDIKEKAAKIAETVAMLQELYQKNNDYDNSQKMQKLFNTAANLLGKTKLPN